MSGIIRNRLVLNFIGPVGLAQNIANKIRCPDLSGCQTRTLHVSSETPELMPPPDVQDSVPVCEPPNAAFNLRRRWRSLTR